MPPPTQRTNVSRETSGPVRGRPQAMWAQNGTHANFERRLGPGAPGFRKDAWHMPRSRDPPSCCDPSSPRATLAWVPFCAQKPNRRSARHRLARCHVPGRYASKGNRNKCFTRNILRAWLVLPAVGGGPSRSAAAECRGGGRRLRRCDAVTNPLSVPGTAWGLWAIGRVPRRLALRATRDRRVARCTAPKASASPKGPRHPPPHPLRTFL